jgi:thiol-disulfide isomerase/thioredoxin
MKAILILMMTGLFGTAAMAQAPTRGIAGQPAPAWGVTQWLNLPADRARLDITDFKGKVVYLYGFQAWCPGCHKHGFPTLKQIIAKYGDDPGVAIVAVQTAFEGFRSNDLDAAKDIVKRYDLKIPVGHSGSAAEPSAFMRHYRTGGTPWTIIIDRDGIVRFNDFHIDAGAASRLIDQLGEKARIGG